MTSRRTLLSVSRRLHRCPHSPNICALSVIAAGVDRCLAFPQGGATDTYSGGSTAAGLATGGLQESHVAQDELAGGWLAVGGETRACGCQGSGAVERQGLLSGDVESSQPYRTLQSVKA
eukprot:5243274-Amphidinium_carterae.2